MAELREDELFISDVTYHVLQRLAVYDEVRLFLDAVQVLLPTRYHKRWARRICETTGLTREDTTMVALATFGTTRQGNILGAHRLITYDYRLINGYLNHLNTLERRFRAMAAPLQPPFSRGRLP